MEITQTQEFKQALLMKIMTQTHQMKIQIFLKSQMKIQIFLKIQIQMIQVKNQVIQRTIQMMTYLHH